MSVQDLTNAQVTGLFQVAEQAVRLWASHHEPPHEWVGGRRRSPAVAVAELATACKVPLPDWLAGIAASAQWETP